MTNFNKPQDIFDWMSRFINLEQGYTPPSMRPERMQIIGALAGHPEHCAPSIHIAGSKGKGSITAMGTRILTEGGLRVARYTSPHITEYRERITLGDNFFDDGIYLTAGEKLFALAGILTDSTSNEYKAMAEVSDGCAPEPTFFELLTLFYFLCAQEAKVDAMVIETGMGGILDPTNICTPEVSVITIIELEHTEFLGATLREVATAKAGIIKNNKPVLLAAQNREALDVFIKTAKEKNSPLLYYPDVCTIEKLRITREGTNCSVRFKTDQLFDKPLELSLSIPGEVQAQNAAMAAMAVKIAFPDIDIKTVQKGIAGFKIPARFEKLQAQPPVIVDGAHTDISVHLCVQTFTELYGEDGILIFGCALGKNAQAMAKSLLPHFSQIIITTPGTYKVSKPEDINETFLQMQKENPQHPTTITFIKETQNGIKTALGIAGKKNLPVLGIGSFYLAAEIRDFVFNGTI
ncbi:bifunctional folylpolyglutamate synthase/dihydrofolate synthase [Spirochaetia bacterium]|nr:bifunctional folylpolyglutamate synthase/dihydrofolate synthase [Spirochaetia bacterium]